MEKIKVLIADDHRVVREGLAAILKTKDDINVVGEAQDGVEAVEKTRTLLPDVVLMDVSMPRMGGVEATRQIKREFPHIGIVALTMYEEQQYIFDLVRAGATGYLLKDSESSQIVAAIRAIYRGESLIACAAWALSEAGAQLFDDALPWEWVSDQEVPLALHDGRVHGTQELTPA